MTKTTCPISRQDFTTHAKQVIASEVLDGIPMTPRQFSTGSFGWGHSGKVYVPVNGTSVLCQVSLNITVVGSKEVAK